MTVACNGWQRHVHILRGDTTLRAPQLCTCLLGISLCNKLVLATLRIICSACRLLLCSRPSLLLLKAFYCVCVHRQAPLPLLERVSCSRYPQISVRSEGLPMIVLA